MTWTWGGDAARVLVVGDGAAAECFGVGEMDPGPDRGGWVLEFVAGADDLGFSECGQEHGDVAVADAVACAEFLEGGEEALAGVEPDAEGAPGRELLAMHRLVVLSSGG